jgi:hypothetical protein
MGKATTLSHSSVDMPPIMYTSFYFYLHVIFPIHSMYSTNDLNQYITCCQHVQEIILLML